MKRMIALWLSVLALMAALCGCGMVPLNENGKPQEPEALRAAIEMEFACEIQRDEAGAFQLFHPDSVTEEGFHQEGLGPNRQNTIWKENAP